MFAHETIFHRWNHVQTGKCCGSMCSKMYFTYGATQNERTYRIEIGRHLGPVIEEPLLPYFRSLDPHINFRTVCNRN